LKLDVGYGEEQVAIAFVEYAEKEDNETVKRSTMRLRDGGAAAGALPPAPVPMALPPAPVPTSVVSEATRHGNGELVHSPPSSLRGVLELPMHPSH
jgi:hypothetical protein